MPQYKLTYFATIGIGEFIRYIFSYAGEDFEDVRHDLVAWPEVKPKTPHGVLPTLEIDGKVYDQSLAIGRYLAKEFKLAGVNNLEDLEIDSIVDTISDYRILFMQYLWEQNPEEKSKKKDLLINEKIPYYLSKFEDQVKRNGDYFVGGRVTWADLFFASLRPYLELIIGFDTLKDYKALDQLTKTVDAIPNIKKWIDKRPTYCCLRELFKL